MNPALYGLFKSSARGDDTDVARRAFGWSTWSDMPGTFYTEDGQGNQHRLTVGDGWVTHHVRHPETGEVLVSNYSSLAEALAHQGMRSTHPVAPDYSDYQPDENQSPHLEASWDAMKVARSRNARKLLPDLSRELARRGLIENPRAAIRRDPPPGRGRDPMGRGIK